LQGILENKTLPVTGIPFFEMPSIVVFLVMSSGYLPNTHWVSQNINKMERLHQFLPLTYPTHKKQLFNVVQFETNSEIMNNAPLAESFLLVQIYFLILSLLFIN
jgi:hypothetical protein